MSDDQKTSQAITLNEGLNVFLEGYTAEEAADILNSLSGLYRYVGGDGLLIQEGTSLEVDSLIPVMQ